MAMRKVGLLGTALLSVGLLAAAPAEAGWRGGYGGWHGGYGGGFRGVGWRGGHGGWRGGYGYRRGIGPGAAIGLGIAGLAVGSAIAANGYGYGRPVGYYGGYGYPAYGGYYGYGY